MKRRLDELLVEQGHVATRSRARDAILRGMVLVNGTVVTKPGASTSADSELAIAPEAGSAYVSRGALKLITALNHFHFDPKSMTVLDVGASTGGFTEVLLERGAGRVYAIDVGHGQLHPRIAARPEVVSFEGLDIRKFDPALIGRRPGATVIDVSFISLTKVLPALLDVTDKWIVALIKPQFEVGRDGVGKGGIVRNEAVRAGAVDNIAALVRSTPGWTLQGIIPSPLEGGSGNTEYLMGMTRGS
jgi:23S rRNA (cytidine1920-2'-O)/16S rRNA (cytidine1409-2'-O)-methyltransferase